MISFFRSLILVLTICAITGCVSTKTYKKDLDITTEVMWKLHHRIQSIELEQIKRILEERINQFENGEKE